jgi:hypothetical protein
MAALMFGLYILWLGVTGIGGTLLVVQGIDAARTNFSGVSGSVQVGECRTHTKDFQEVGWDCTGRFTSDDGRVVIPKVDLVPYLDERPDGPVSARVAGAGAATARPPGFAWWVPLGGGIAFLGIFAYTLLLTFKDDTGDENGDGRPRRRTAVRFEHRKRASRPTAPGVR